MTTGFSIYTAFGTVVCLLGIYFATKCHHH